jgi:hypothetical protein
MLSFKQNLDTFNDVLDIQVPQNYIVVGELSWRSSKQNQYEAVDVFGSSGRYSPPGQLFLEMKMSRSQRKPLNSSKKPRKK